MQLNKQMFREYDIRGIWNEDITEEISYHIGRAIATKVTELGKDKMLVGYDNRLSSPIIEKNLIKGLTEGGINVIRLGLVTTPMYYYAWDRLNIHAGVMITASHNPKEYNGFKISYNGIHNIFGKEVEISNRCYHTRIIDNTFSTTSGNALRVVTEWFSGGCFLEGNTFTNFNCVFNNDRNKEKAIRLYFKDNTFNGGTLYNQSRYQVIKGLTVSNTTSLNGKFEDITIN